MKSVFQAMSLIIAFILFLLSETASAASVDRKAPYPLIQQVGGQLFTDIAKLNGLPEDEKRQQLRELIREQLMPHIDTKFVSFKLLGKHIRDINKAQAISFMDAVELYLLNTYTNVLMSYKGQDVRFIEPVFDVASEYASVKSEIVSPNAPTIDMQFKFRKSKSGDWQVYDIEAESISLLDAKQKEIVSRISEVGIDTVTAELKSKS